MKKCRLLFLLILLLSLCGCSMIPNILSESRIETLKSWSFQYNSGTDDYSLFFALCDESDKYLSADVDVDIRIIDDNDNLLYPVLTQTSPPYLQRTLPVQKKVGTSTRNVTIADSFSTHPM